MEICSAFFLCYVSGAGVACGRVHHAELLLSRPQFFHGTAAIADWRRL